MSDPTENDESDIGPEQVEPTDLHLLLAHITREGIVPADSGGTWDHMGAVLADASLQAGIGYKSAVLPRVRRLVKAWPDALTTARVSKRLAEESLPEVLAWKSGSKKIAVFEALVQAFIELEIETTDDLHAAYLDPAKSDILISRLMDIKGVKHKTVDYLAILVGIEDRVAIDSQLTSFAVAAGVQATGYGSLATLYRAAAADIGCSARALDSAVWAHMSGS